MRHPSPLSGESMFEGADAAFTIASLRCFGCHREEAWKVHLEEGDGQCWLLRSSARGRGSAALKATSPCCRGGRFASSAAAAQDAWPSCAAAA